ncbi:hypothetical protein TL16_g00749 [Triparma laevis f. inornata]|uniref:Uncharacterized protein n=1 Tax=Triparma laevis f. inornata TaxID=1714386 RepID=A0A9W6ZA21_9STRA|nr:hypothetical protein TL16_g00749 [Triparma laevis f. inornata]
MSGSSGLPKGPFVAVFDGAKVTAGIITNIFDECSVNYAIVDKDTLSVTLSPRGGSSSTSPAPGGGRLVTLSSLENVNKPNSLDPPSDDEGPSDPKFVLHTRELGIGWRVFTLFFSMMSTFFKLIYLVTDVTIFHSVSENIAPPEPGAADHTVYTIWLWLAFFHMGLFFNGNTGLALILLLAVYIPILSMYVNARRRIAQLEDKPLEDYLVSNVIIRGGITFTVLLYFTAMSMRCTLDTWLDHPTEVYSDRDALDYWKTCAGVFYPQLSLSFFTVLAFLFNCCAMPITDWKKISRKQLLGFEFPGFKLKIQMLLLVASLGCTVFLAGSKGTQGKRTDMQVAFHTGWGTGAGVLIIELFSILFGRGKKRGIKSQYQMEVELNRKMAAAGMAPGGAL